jgi:hypothetical protein
MKKYLTCSFLFISTILLANKIDKAQKYKATIWAFPYGKIEGTIYINLFDENKGKTSIEIVNETEKTATSYSKRVEKVEVLTTAIKLIMIDSVYYKFISFQLSPIKRVNNFCVAVKSDEDKTYQLSLTDTTKYLLTNVVTEENGEHKFLYNCSLKRIYGKDSFAIYQFGLEWNENFAIVALPKDAIYGRFYLINHKYFTRQEIWKTVQFRRCKTMKENLNNEKDGWNFNDTSTQQEKIIVWKKYIDAWEQCIENNQ